MLLLCFIFFWLWLWLCLLGSHEMRWDDRLSWFELSSAERKNNVSEESSRVESSQQTKFTNQQSPFSSSAQLQMTAKVIDLSAADADRTKSNDCNNWISFDAVSCQTYNLFGWAELREGGIKLKLLTWRWLVERSSSNLYQIWSLHKTVIINSFEASNYPRACHWFDMKYLSVSLSARPPELIDSYSSHHVPHL